MKASKTLSLIAEWPLGQEFTSVRPEHVYWADGTSATHDDYMALQDYTYLLKQQGSRMVKHIFPSIIADVKFDNASGRWRVSGPEVESFCLELFDPNIADDQITAEMSTYRVVYKHRILRG